MPKPRTKKTPRRGARPAARPKPRPRRPAPAPASPQPEPEFIEGRHPVLEALRAGRPINRVILSGGGRHSGVAEILHLAQRAGIVVDRVDAAAMERLSPRGKHQGVAAFAAAKDYAGLNDLLAAPRAAGVPPLVAVLDGITDPQNLGAIIRTVEGVGGHGVVIPKRRAAGLTAAVAKSSSGALEFVPVARVTNLTRSLRDLADAGVWSVGIDPSAEQDFREADYTAPTAIVIGAEGKGLSRVVREACDTVVSIPMRGQVASLNASVAAALALYEALRQREGAASGS